MPLIEKFVVTLYDASMSTSSVNECRRYLFTKKERSFENIPPTRDALALHAKKAAYMSGVWGQCLILNQNLPSPSDWGWTTNSSQQWTPAWTSLPTAAQSGEELIRCSCKTCDVKCKCIRAGLRCTELCSCRECRDFDSSDDDFL